MKRQLIQNVKVMPYTSGDVIDRRGFLSAILAAKVSAGEMVAIKVAHCDTAAGTFEDVKDEFIVVGSKPEAAVAAGDDVNFDLDLVGCKQFIKITATLTGADAAATYAVALGDAVEVPV